MYQFELLIAQYRNYFFPVMFPARHFSAQAVKDTRQIILLNVVNLFFWTTANKMRDNIIENSIFVVFIEVNIKIN